MLDQHEIPVCWTSPKHTLSSSIHGQTEVLKIAQSFVYVVCHTGSSFLEVTGGRLYHSQLALA